MRGSTAAAAAAGAGGGASGDAGGDNSQTALQRLLADMQLLQSKLHKFDTQSPAVNNNVQQTAGAVLPTDKTDPKIDELKQHYDAKVLLCVVPYT